MTERTDPYTTAEIAKLRNVTPVTVRRWRCDGKGPPWKYANGISGPVLYDADDYRRWDVEQKAKQANGTTKKKGS